jgi:hypothetical protein
MLRKRFRYASKESAVIELDPVRNSTHKDEWALLQTRQASAAYRHQHPLLIEVNHWLLGTDTTYQCL